jgi:hypothetical protein
MGVFARETGGFRASVVRHPPRHRRLTATLYDTTCWLMPELDPTFNLRNQVRQAPPAHLPAHCSL